MECCDNIECQGTLDDIVLAFVFVCRNILPMILYITHILHTLKFLNIYIHIHYVYIYLVWEGCASPHVSCNLITSVAIPSFKFISSQTMPPFSIKVSENFDTMQNGIGAICRYLGFINLVTCKMGTCRP